MEALADFAVFDAFVEESWNVAAPNGHSLSSSSPFLPFAPEYERVAAFHDAGAGSKSVLHPVSVGSELESPAEDRSLAVNAADLIRSLESVEGNPTASSEVWLTHELLLDAEALEPVRA